MRIKGLKYLEIEDYEIMKAVEKAWENYRKRLKLLPSSFSGHNHPPKDREVGGMKNHIEYLCWYINSYCIEFEKNSKIKDILMASAFFHDISSCDIMKIEPRLKIIDEKTIQRELIITRHNEEFHFHPLKSADLAKSYLIDAGVSTKTIDIIVNIIKSHMGHWCKDLPQPKTDLELAFALADFIVSRREFRLEEIQSK